MYRRTSTPLDHEKPGRLRPVFICLGFFAGIVAVLAMLTAMEKERPRYHGSSCLNGSAMPRGHTVVVIDQTNAISDQGLQYVKEILRNEYQLLKEQDRLTLMGLQSAKGVPADESGPSLFFTTCRMPRGTEVSILDNNPALVESQFEELVGKQFAASINSLREVREAKWSPIFETLQSVSDDPMFSSPAIARRLVLISDMIQNTRDNSQYRRKTDKSSVKTLAAPFMRASLLGVDVRVHYIPRNGLDAIQSPEHEAFWKSYFVAAGAKSLQIGWGMAGDDRIAGIVWNAAPVPLVPATPMLVAPPSLQPDVPPAPDGALLPGNILVHGTRHAAFINYEIDWRRFEPSNYLVFDARRVLFLTSRQDDRECYVSVPLVTKIARDPAGGRFGPGRVMRRLESYEQSEKDFVQRFAANVGVVFETATCEIVGARIVASTNTVPGYRALRCTGPNFSNIEEQDWIRFTHATAPGVVATRLAVVSGRQQLPPADVNRIVQSLRDKSVCPAEPLSSLQDKLLLGLQWLDERDEPVASSVD